MDRFRPNIVISGTTPFEEDHWTNFTVGNCEFATPKKCGRCPVINIDQKNGRSTKEVLKTLTSFRRDGNKVIFGMNGCWINKDLKNPVIQVGDPLILN